MPEFNEFMAYVLADKRHVYEFSGETVEEMQSVINMRLDIPAVLRHGRDTDGWSVEDLKDVFALCEERLTAE